MFTQMLVDAGVVSAEMESDTVFVLGAYHGWRTGALYASTGPPNEVKPAWAEESFRKGEEQAILVALRAMCGLARADSVA